MISPSWERYGIIHLESQERRKYLSRRTVVTMKLQGRKISMTSARQVKRISGLLPCSQIGKYTVTCNDNNKVIGINEQIVLCTNAEYKIIRLLSAGKPLADPALIDEVFHCCPDSSTQNSVRKHVEHLREKLQGTGLDIHRIHAYGYLLVETE